RRNYRSFDEEYQFTGWYLLYGTKYGKTVDGIKRSSRNFDSAGITVLSKGAGFDNLSCFVKYNDGMKVKRHQHNAQLDMAFIKGSEYIITMPGNASYASTLSDGWYRSAIAHNTLSFNEMK